MHSGLVVLKNPGEINAPRGKGINKCICLTDKSLNCANIVMRTTQGGCWPCTPLTIGTLRKQTVDPINFISVKLCHKTFCDWYAGLHQLAEWTVLEAVKCGFESHVPHQDLAPSINGLLYGLITQRLVCRTVSPDTGVRFPVRSLKKFDNLKKIWYNIYVRFKKLSFTFWCGVLAIGS